MQNRGSGYVALDPWRAMRVSPTTILQSLRLRWLRSVTWRLSN